mgnify:CR=1 FL=1
MVARRVPFGDRCRSVGRSDAPLRAMARLGIDLGARSLRSYEIEKKVARLARQLAQVESAKLATPQEDAHGIDVVIRLVDGSLRFVQVKSGTKKGTSTQRRHYRETDIRVVHIPPGLPRDECIHRIVVALA